MKTTIQTFARRVLNNRAVSFGSVIVLALLFTGMLSATPAMNEIPAAAAPTEEQFATTAGSMTVTIKADGKTQTVSLASGTVADALFEAGLTADEDDNVAPSLKTHLEDGLTVTVTRIDYVERVELENIPFESEEERTADLAEGKKEKKQDGADGIRERVFCDKVVDGVVEKSTELRSSVVSEPTPEIWRVGKKKNAPIQKPAGVVVDASGKPQNYKSCLTGTATAYTNDRGLAGDWTASGLPAQRGVVAVNPDVIPLGTKLYIASPDGSIVYGYAVAGDTGGAMYSGEATVDLFYDTYEECIQFGRRTMNIYILE